MEAERVIWCLLALAALVALEVMGLRRFYARLDPRDRCHCDQSWRGEFIANFGHEPEVSRLAPLAPVAQPTPPGRSVRRSGCGSLGSRTASVDYDTVRSCEPSGLKVLTLTRIPPAHG